MLKLQQRNIKFCAGVSESEVSEDVKSKPIPPTIQEITPEDVPVSYTTVVKLTVMMNFLLDGLNRQTREDIYLRIKLFF